MASTPPTTSTPTTSTNNTNAATTRQSIDSGGGDDLASINQSFVSKDSHLPSVSLPDGTKIQTGTVGALLQNIKAYDRVVAGQSLPDDATRAELEHRLTIPIPTLRKVGLFDLFPAEEWVKEGASKGGTVSAGRRFVGRKAMEMGY